MPSLAFDPFDPFQVSAATTAAAAAASSSMVSVSRTGASNLQHHSHSERISNISSSFFGLAESSLATSVPHEAFSSSSSFSYSLHSASSSSSLSATSAAPMSLDMSSSSSSSPPSSPYSSSSSSPLSSFDSNQSLLGSLSSTLLRPGGGANTNTAERKREDVLEGILSLVLEELREVKQHNREMRKQLNKVVKRQDKTEQQLLQVATSSPSPSNVPSSSTAASSGSSSSSTAAEPTLTAPALAEILNRMPFLLDYSVSPSTFVINDARYPPLPPLSHTTLLRASLTPRGLHNRKPFYALRVISQYIGEDSSPPIFIFVNNSFAELSGYALVPYRPPAQTRRTDTFPDLWLTPCSLQNELLGRNVNKVTCVDEQAKKEMLSKLFQSAPQTISEPFALQVMMRRKDGRVLQCSCRHQAFYNELGYVSPPPPPIPAFALLCLTPIDGRRFGGA